MVRTVQSNGMPSVTHYKPLISNNKFSLLELWLETGRTHQIRCHMSYLGHTLIGDDLYGGSLKIMSRQALHCGEVNFVHPVTKNFIKVKAELPIDMKKVIKQNINRDIY